MNKFKLELFECISAFRRLPMNERTKTHCLGIKLGEYEDNWNVVGISKNALIRFKENNYKMVSRMGVHRAHIIDRKVSYSYMIENVLDVESLWEYYLKTNDTILTTSTENMSKNKTMSHVYPIPKDLGLFKTKLVSWTHSKSEIEYIRNLCEIENI
jgi:hypothetical protein